MQRSLPGSAAKDRQADIRQILAILHKWGIHTVGQLAALDREPLCARLGPEAGRLWERANGTATRLLKFVQPPKYEDADLRRRRGQI
jgi:nucleotidyltransferase/DNA polymerase involved in DNA repair